MHKSRSEYRDGYKAHIAVEPETGLVTSAIVTPANVSDAKTALDLVAAEPGGLEILGDSAYGSGNSGSPASPWASPVDQADSVATCGPRWVLP